MDPSSAVFEIYESLPPEALQEELPATTTLARKTADVKRAVRFLLQTQRGNGAGTTRTTTSGARFAAERLHGPDGAGALALREWGDPAEVKTAVERAEKYMRDETHIAGATATRSSGRTRTGCSTSRK